MGKHCNCCKCLQSRIGMVYALYDPRSPSLPRYVGKTTVGLRGRLRSHKHHMKKRPEIPLSVWLSGIYGDGLVPTIRMLEQCPIVDLSKREEAWIMFFRPLNCLTNISNGAGGKGIHRPFSGDLVATTARLKRYSDAGKKRVVCEDGTEYPSVAEACDKIGVSQQSFRECHKNGWKIRGRFWKIIEKV